ncbi:YrhB domain-containing protein [Spirillospora sp. NPDC052269]
MIDRQHAVRLIEDQLRAEERRFAERGAVVPLGIKKIIEHRLGWIGLWQSQAYLDSGDVRYVLMDTGAYLVDRYDGSVHHIPSADYTHDLWEEDYEQRIKPPQNIEPDPWSEVPFAAELRETLDGEGRIAAIRFLRRRVRALNMAQANQYVIAIAVGEHPPAPLLDLARPPEPFPRPFGITTLTGPNPASADAAGSARAADSVETAK